MIAEHVSTSKIQNADELLTSNG